MIDLKVINDGALCLMLNNKIILKFGAGIDGDTFRYNSVICKDEKLEFMSTKGSIYYSTEKLSENHAVIHSGLKYGEKPHSVNVIYKAVTEIEGAFRQGFGMCGPSGYLTKDEIIKQGEFNSYGIVALKYSQGYVAVFSKEHVRYTTKFHIDTDSIDEKHINFTASFLTENTINECALPDMHFIFGDNLEQLLIETAKIIASSFKSTIREPAYHWCSWYYFYNNLDLNQLTDFLNGVKTLKPDVPLKYIQIDAGYCPALGDWLEDFHLFPGGLKKAVDLIKSYGYKPGIWIGPYMVGSRSKLYVNHPEWVLHDKNGKPIVKWQMYNEPKIWGYQDEEYYVLDTSHPKALKYIRYVFKELKAWGVEFFKTDFMLWGVVDSRDAARKTSGKTSIEYYRDFMECIREDIVDSYWLGCIAPFMPMLGYVNGMRIAGDVGAQWNDDGFGPTNLIQEITSNNYYNNIFWQNDPDAVMLRDFHILLKDYEIEALAFLQALSGGMIYTSDILDKLTYKRLDLFRFIMPDVIIHRPSVPFLDKNEKVICLHHILDKRHIIYLFNPGKDDININYSLNELAGINKAYLKEYGKDEISVNKEDSINGKIYSHSYKLFFIDTHAPIDYQIKNLWSWGKDSIDNMNGHGKEVDIF